MRLLKAVSYLGPNVVAPLPLVHLQVAVEGPRDWPIDEAGQRCSDRLLALLPGLADHPGTDGDSASFEAALRAAPALPLALVTARVASELQRRHDDGIAKAGIRVREAGTMVDIFFGYSDPDIGLWSGQAAISLVLSLLAPEARPQNRLPASTGPEQVLAIFERRKKSLQLDQTAIALIRGAEERGIPWFVLDRGKRIVQLGQGHHLRRICQSITTKTGYIETRLQDDKAATNRMLAEVRLPVARQVLVQDAEAAVRAARQIGYPVAVKPMSSHKGRGITLEPPDDEAVRKAFTKAREHSPHVLVETFIAGKDHRVMVVAGRMSAAAHRVPGSVTGDGRSTVAELVEEINRDPERDVGYSRALTLLELDDQADIMLARMGYDRDSVPAEGEVVVLRGTANLSTGGTAIDVTDQVHPVNRRMLERTARVMGLDVAGIDFITPDIARPYSEVGGAICEVNASPGLRAHFTAKGDAPNVVGPILDMLFPEGANGRIPIAAVTGTNGKTTTSRMLAHILKMGGGDIGVSVIGLATTNGVFINEERVAQGDLAGIPGARVLLQDPSVEAAVLETARGGLARSGLAVDWCDVGAVLNVASDHIGYDGIHNLDDMARLKGRVAEAARRLAVLNADDARCLALAKLKPPERICLVTLAPLSPDLRRHLDRGGLVISLEEREEGPTIVLQGGNASRAVIAARQIPATFDGAARHNIQNAMAAVGLAHGLGISIENIAAALGEFRSDADFNLGRLNLFEVLPFKVVLDYGHNPAGIRATCDTLRSIPAQGQRICVLANVGSRQAEHFAEVAEIVSDQFDLFICSRNERSSGRVAATRSYPSEEIPGRLAEAIAAKGIGSDRIRVIDSSRTAVENGLQSAGKGDLLLIFSGEPDWCRERIAALGQPSKEASD